MTDSLIWISGASGGIGEALSRTVPWDDARVLGISRSRPTGAEHLEADLSDPASWPVVGESFRRELEGFEGSRVVFVHAAGTVDPIGFAGEVDTAAYVVNVMINAAAPLVLGHLFLEAVRAVEADRHVVMLTSGAAKSVYAGWASYGAGKAAIDQWVRDVGAEQETRGGVHVVSIAPGTVDTAMQAQLRETREEDFPKRQKFIDVKAEGKLTPPEVVARDIWGVVERGYENGAVLDLRDLAKSSSG